MKNATPFLLAALAAVASYGCSRAEAQSLKPVDGRGAVELVVYADDFAMVSETRKVELKEGKVRVGVQGVSKALDQNSVRFEWPKVKDARVVSSTYDLGVGSSDRLLNRFLGREVELVYRGDNGREGERVSGILEVAEPGNVVVRADGKYIVNPSATIEAPADAGIVTLPQLSAEVESKTAGPTDLAVSYMTTGLSWNADYTVTLAPDSDQLGLECWATVTNRTGADFPDAKISFVAGSPNRAVRERDKESQLSYFQSGRSTAGKAVAGEARMSPEVSAPQAMGELYAYPYKSTATIRQDQMNRVRMMGSDAVRVKKVYSVVLPALDRYYAAFSPNPDQRLTATMGINFQNAEASGLGLPLPAGAVRVYEPDKGGTSRYVGAASIGDTPKDAKISLELTNVFDVYARARPVGFKKIDKKHVSRTVEVVLNNDKAGPVELRLVESIGGPWKISEETHQSHKLNSGQNEWKVTIPAGGETKLRYTVVLGG